VHQDRLQVPSPASSEADLFARLGKTPKVDARTVSKVDPDASGELDELGADDILEVSDAVAVAAPAPASTEVVVTAPADHPLASTQKLPDAVPSTTVQGIAPPAPATVPVPVEETAPASVPERTLQLKTDAAIAKAAALSDLSDALESPGGTEIMVRTPELAKLLPQAAAQPAAAAPLHGMPSNVTPPHGSAAAHASLHTPAAPPVAPAPQHVAWHAGAPAPQHRPSSLAPVAVDAPPRARVPSIPQFPVHTPKKGMSPGAIAGLVFGAVALVGLVGAGGFAASRALSAKEAAVTVASAPQEQAPSNLAANAAASPASPAPMETAAPAEAMPTPTTGGVDVAALPSVPPRTPAAPQAASPAMPAVAVAQAQPARAGTSPTANANAKPAATPPAPTATAAAAEVKPKFDPNAPLPPPNANGSAPASVANGNAPLPAPTAAQPRATTGVVQVDPSLRAVLVDGSYRRASDGVVVLSCGPHRIKAGMAEARVVDVPCGGSVAY